MPPGATHAAAILIFAAFSPLMLLIFHDVSRESPRDAPLAPAMPPPRALMPSPPLSRHDLPDDAERTIDALAPLQALRAMPAPCPEAAASDAGPRHYASAAALMLTPRDAMIFAASPIDAPRQMPFTPQQRDTAMRALFAMMRRHPFALICAAPMLTLSSPEMRSDLLMPLTPAPPITAAAAASFANILAMPA